MVNSFLKEIIKNCVGTLNPIRQFFYSKGSLSFFNSPHICIEFFWTLKIIGAACLSLVVKVFFQRWSLRKSSVEIF